MKRSITEVLRRSLVSTLANWPVIVARVAETLLCFGLVIVAVVACVVPVIVSAGLSEWKIPEARTPLDATMELFVAHGLLFIYLLLLLFVVAGLLLAIHSFVTAGAARVYVDADRATPNVPEPARESFAVFTMERFMGGARSAWLRIFWVYNGAWGLYALIILVPLLIVLILTVLSAAAENVALTIGISCAGVAVITLVAVPLAFVIGVWSAKAVVVCVGRELPAREALRSGWREVKGDFLRHFAVFFLIAVISFGAAALLSGFAPFSLGMSSLSRDHLHSMFFAPMQLTLTLAQNVVSNAVGCWFVAAFAAMTEEKR